jgi:hypothetical protein
MPIRKTLPEQHKNYATFLFKSQYFLGDLLFFVKRDLPGQKRITSSGVMQNSHGTPYNLKHATRPITPFEPSHLKGSLNNKIKIIMSGDSQKRTDSSANRNPKKKKAEPLRPCLC